MVKAPELMPSPGAFLRAGPRDEAEDEEGMMLVRRGIGRTAFTLRRLRALRSACALALLALAASGCFFRDPLDPHGSLNHKVVTDLSDAEHMAKGREAYDRARGRVGNVQTGMTVPEVE